MGNKLETPITEKDTCTGKASGTENAETLWLYLNYGASSMQGWRIHMEDAHICLPQLGIPSLLFSSSSPREADPVLLPVNPTGKTTTMSNDDSITPLPGHALFSVFDGHGGSFASKFASRKLCRLLYQNQQFQEYVSKIVPIVANIATATTKGEMVTNSTVNKSKKKKGKKKINNKNNNNDDKLVVPNKKTLSEWSNLLQSAFQRTFIELDRELFLHTRKDQPQETISTSPIKDKISSDDTEEDDWDFHTPEDGDNDGDAPERDDPPVIDDDEDGDDGDAGTTAVVVLVTPHMIVCTNLGDSRAILCCCDNNRNNMHKKSNDFKPAPKLSSASSGKKQDSSTTLSTSVTVKPLSYDHKPDLDEEKQRIEGAGGMVNFGRVDGELAVSRALGDFSFKNPDLIIWPPTSTSDNMDLNDETTIMERAQKQKVSAVPDIVVHPRDYEKDRFLVVACDGIWDVLSNEECVTLITTLMEEGESDLGLICEEVLGVCLKKGSQDNMTIIIISFSSSLPMIGQGGGVMRRRKHRSNPCSVGKSKKSF